MSARGAAVMIERLASRRERVVGARHSAPLEILVVDDDQATRLSLVYALADAGHHVTEAADGQEAEALGAERAFDVAILDVRLPKIDGLAVFRKLRQSSPTTAVILMTAFATVSDAVASLRSGAYDYVTKPFDPEEFTLRIIGHLAEHRALRQELEEARTLVASRDAGSPIVGSTPAMLKLIERIHMVAQTDAPALIVGETGTGKALVAHTVHARGPRKAAPFVAVNCSAFPEGLLEAELFGHSGGGPAPARAREGRFRAAEGGTLLLDEVSDLPLVAQAKLARVLESGLVQPLGEGPPVAVNVRVLACTTRDLRRLVAEGTFREDLYFRINVVDLELVPLRERRADLPLLLAHFLRRFYPGRVPPGITPRAWAALMAYGFPGNVREFAHAIERAVVLSHGSEIDLEHLPPEIAGRDGATTAAESAFRPLASALRAFEREHVEQAMRLASGARGRAAELLGISRKSLVEKLKAHGMLSATERRNDPPR